MVWFVRGILSAGAIIAFHCMALSPFSKEIV